MRQIEYRVVLPPARGEGISPVINPPAQVQEDDEILLSASRVRRSMKLAWKRASNRTTPKDRATFPASDQQGSTGERISLATNLPGKSRRDFKAPHPEVRRVW